MSNFFLADRIKELSRVEGTNDIALDGAVAGFSSFADFFASGDVVFYAITDNVQYEVGSGTYQMSGSNRALTRNVIRSSDITVGPYHVNGTSNSGPTDGQTGYFHPVWLSRSAALSGVGYTDGPFSAASGYTFDEFPGQTFYYVPEHAGSGEPSHPALSGVDFNAASVPVSFSAGVKEVFVTYPGKTSVYNGVGLEADISEPKHSGIAFWRNEQIINYSQSLVFDEQNNFIGLSQPSPQYALDIGGDPSYSIINVSGIVEGGSGILFSGGQLTYTNLTASGGLQLEPFLRNQLGDAAGGVIQLSGLVDQFIGFEKQTPGTVFMGPDPDWCGTPPCDPDYPSFRALVLDDLPDLGGAYVIQQNKGLDVDSANISPANFQPGMVAIYHSSGNITYDSGIYFDYTNDRLLINADPNVDTAMYNIDVRGDLSAQSGYFNQLLFTDDIIRIGALTASDFGNTTENFYTVAIGNSAGNSLSGVFDGVLIGRSAGEMAESSSGVVGIGKDALKSALNSEDIVAIGTNAGYDISGVDSSTFIGYDAGAGAYTYLNCIVAGSGAGASSRTLTDIVAIGKLAGSGSSNSANVIGLGKQTFVDSSDSIQSLAMGFRALSAATDVDRGFAFGYRSLENGSGILHSIGIGGRTLTGGTDLEYVIGFGQGAGSGVMNASNALFIGQCAGMSGMDIANQVSIGFQAGYQSSGTQNIYIGEFAGVSVSGHENIEIITSGTALSFLTHEASGKLNLGTIVVGDIYQGRVGIGANTDANPDATLLVSPRQADETAFVIRHQGSGSRSPYMALQSGDSTTFYHITNSGDVIHSGCVNPSGGVLLAPITPSDWMDSTANRLYNDAGTLKFNGSTITVGGSYSWNLTNGLLADDEITDAQTVTISGVSGVDIEYDASTNVMQVSASGLSGVLQQQITASNYVFFAAASGDGGANGETKQMDQNSVLAVSGVSGVLVDFLNLTDGTNDSGVYILGYDPAVTYSFAVTNGDWADDTITNAETITISGVSGVRAEYDPATNFFRVGANELSGILQTQVTDNLNLWSGYLSNEFGPILVSGVSGIAAYASGQIDQFTVKSGTSGILLENNTYILDHGGSGSLKRLSVNDNSSVLIGDLAAHGAVGYGSGVSIGPESSLNASGSYDSVSLGYRSSYNASGCFESVSIGRQSQLDAKDNVNGVNIGFQAGANLVDSPFTISIGPRAGGASSGIHYGIFIGESAGKSVNDLTATSESGLYPIGIGAYALYDSEDLAAGALAIGRRAGESASGVQNSIMIGERAGLRASGVTNGVIVGPGAGENVSGINQSVLIGYDAGADAIQLGAGVGIGPTCMLRASGDPATAPEGQFIFIGNSAGVDVYDFDRLLAIGAFAGVASSGCNHSVFLGPYAGQMRKGANSVIISNRSEAPTGYDAPWAEIDEKIVDIADIFQGYVPQVDQYASLHIGRPLDDDGGDIDGNEISDSALNITSPFKSNTILSLRFDPDATGVNTDNQADAVRSQIRDGLGNPEATWNTLVNSNGWLNLPVAKTFSNTGSNTVLYDANGVEIEKRAGVIVQYQVQQLGFYEHGIAIVVNNGNGSGPLVWKKIEISDEFSSPTLPA